MTKERKSKPMGRPRKAAQAPKAPPLQPVKAVPRAPSWLSEPARAEWRRAARQLTERGDLTPGDLPVLATFCSAVGRLQQAELLIAKEGLCVKAQNGVPTKHPAIAIANEASSTIKTLSAALGLTPASRSRGNGNGAPRAAAPSNWEGLIDG